MLNDLLTLVLANYFMGCCLSDKGEFVKSLHCFEKALEINVMTNAQWGIAAIKANIITWGYGRLGNVELAYQTSQEALRIANESGDIYSKAHAHFGHGCSYYLKGSLKEAKKHLLKSADLLQKSKQFALAAYSNYYLSAIYMDIEKYETSEQFLRRSSSFWQHINFGPSYLMLNKIGIALAKVKNKEKDINLNEIFKWHEDIKCKWAEGVAQNCIGAILLNVDDLHISEAEDWINRSIETNQKYGMMWYLARSYVLYSEFYYRKNDQAKARDNLGKAIKIFKGCGADGWVEKYEKELTEL